MKTSHIKAARAEARPVGKPSQHRADPRSDAANSSSRAVLRCRLEASHRLVVWRRHAEVVSAEVASVLRSALLQAANQVDDVPTSFVIHRLPTGIVAARTVAKLRCRRLGLLCLLVLRRNLRSKGLSNLRWVAREDAKIVSKGRIGALLTDARLEVAEVA